jgi:ribosomal protein S18 acetylase RimI-like enzyme
MTPTITLTDKPDPASIQMLVRELIQFNEQHGGPRNARPLVLLVSDPQTQESLGGLYGATVYDRLKIELIYLPESLRSNGLGRELMRQAEEEAAKRGCRGVLLETFDFQARGFYEQLGYEVYGTLEDFPPGHSLFAMKKNLDPAAQ